MHGMKAFTNIVYVSLNPVSTYQREVKSLNGPLNKFPVKLRSEPQKLAFTNRRRKAVLKNYATNTPLAIDFNYAECVSSPIDLTNMIITIFKIVFTTTIATVIIKPEIIPYSFDLE